MKIIGLVIALSALVSLCLCSCSTVTLAKQDDESMCANDSFYLTPQQVITKQDEALRGNGRAAQDLSYYYNFEIKKTARSVDPCGYGQTSN